MFFTNEVRRIYSSDDVEQIKKIQSENKKSRYHGWLWDYFRQHEHWLDKALEEVSIGERLGFSAWINTPTPQLIGSILFKRKAFYNYKAAELKNLIVDENTIRKSIREEYCKTKNIANEGNIKPDDEAKIENWVEICIQDVWNKLIGKVEGFCRRRGFKRLVFEVAADQVKFISFFLNKDFIINDAKSVTYRSGKVLYNLSKNLPKSYSGDPFFIEDIASWLIEEFLEYRFVDKKYSDHTLPETGNLDVDNTIDISQSRKFSISHSKLKPVKKDDYLSSFLTGKIIIIDDFDVDFQINKDAIEHLIESENLNIILTYNEQNEFRKTCLDKGIKYLSREKDSEIFGKESSINAIDFARSEISGLTLVVSSDFIKKISDIKKDYFVFYLNGNNGVCIEEEYRDRRLILFYSSVIKNCGNKGGIWGFSEVVKFFHSKDAENPNFNFDDFDYHDFFDAEKTNCPDYKKLIKYNEDGRMVCLLLKKPVLLPETVCYLLEDLFGDSSNSLNELISDQMIFSDFYISNEMSQRFYKFWGNIADQVVIEEEATQSTESEFDNPKKENKSEREAMKPTIGILTALPKEYAAVKLMLDNASEYPVSNTNKNRYLIGKIPSKHGGEHEIAVGLLSDMGNNSAAIAATNILTNFPSVNHLIMCGIAGGVPKPGDTEHDVRLGDIVVSDRNGVVQYDLVKEKAKKVTEDRYPPRPPGSTLLDAVLFLKAEEELFNRPWEVFLKKGEKMRYGIRPPDNANAKGDEITYHEDPERQKGLPRVFHGTIAAANKLLKNKVLRDQLASKFNVKAIEMESSGIADATWESDRAGYIVVRGICDYCDENKGDVWQGAAAIASASYVRALIESMHIDR